MRRLSAQNMCHEIMMLLWWQWEGAEPTSSATMFELKIPLFVVINRVVVQQTQGALVHLE